MRGDRHEPVGDGDAREGDRHGDALDRHDIKNRAEAIGGEAADGEKVEELRQHAVRGAIGAGLQQKLTRDADQDGREEGEVGEQHQNEPFGRRSALERLPAG